MPVAVVELVITGAAGRAGFTVRVRVAFPIPPLLIAVSATLNVPDALGVPETRPVAVLTERPPGKPLAPKLVGLLIAVI